MRERVAQVLVAHAIEVSCEPTVERASGPRGALTRVRAARETRDVRRLIVAVALVCGASSIAPVGLVRGQDAPTSADEEARVRFAAGRLALAARSSSEMRP
jgi:hypothetical protein